MSANGSFLRGEEKEAKDSIRELSIPNAQEFNDAWARQGVDQQEWGKLWGEVIKEGAEKIQKNDKVTQAAYSYFVNFLGKKRHEVAEKLFHEGLEFLMIAALYGSSDRYGICRMLDLKEGVFNTYGEDMDATPQSRYDDQYPFLKNHFLSLCSKASDANKDFYRVQTERGIFQPAPIFKSPDPPRRYHLTTLTIYGNFTDKGSFMHKAKCYRGAYIQLALVYLEGDPKTIEYIRVSKMPSGRLEHFWHETEKHYQAVLLWKGSDPQDFYYKLGLLAWHTAIAMPLRNGSTAVNEAMIRSFEIAKGFTPRKFKKGITPDFRAYFTPNPEDFARNFYYFFEGTADLINDTFAVTTPTQEAMTADKVWEGLRHQELSAFKHKSLFRIHRRKDEPFVLPLFRDPTLPNNERNPSRLRYSLEIVKINQNGITGFKNILAIQIQGYIKALKDSGKVGDEMISFLQRPGGFMSIYLSLYQELTSEPVAWNTITFEQFIDALFKRLSSDKTKLMDALECGRLRYLHEEAVIAWIETLPEDQARTIEEHIGARENLQKFQLDDLKKFLRPVQEIKDDNLGSPHYRPPVRLGLDSKGGDDLYRGLLQGQDDSDAPKDALPKSGLCCNIL